MPRTKKPCVVCGSLERYKNGGCKPCQLKKQTVRNKADATGKAKIYAANAQARSEAKLKGESKYEAVEPCYKCNTKIRYTSSGNCFHCQYFGAPEKTEDKPRPIRTTFNQRQKS